MPLSRASAALIRTQPLAFGGHAGAFASPPPSYSPGEASRKKSREPASLIHFPYRVNSLYAFPGSLPMGKVGAASIAGLINTPRHRSCRGFLLNPGAFFLACFRSTRRFAFWNIAEREGAAHADELNSRRAGPAKLAKLVADMQDLLAGTPHGSIRSSDSYGKPCPRWTPRGTHPLYHSVNTEH